MKINKKVLIPVFATAMGLSVIGGVSGAVAWYQYNTKVQASFMGVTTADGGVLQIKKTDGEWGRFANFGDADTKLHPVTFGNMAATDALPEFAYKHPHAGNETKAMTSWDKAVKGTDYHEIKFNLQALQLDESTKTWKAIAANVYLEELVLDSATAGADVAEALRVHVKAGSSNHLYSKSGGQIVTHGNLDLDKDGSDDVVGGYAWNYDGTTKIDYGDGGSQTATAFAPNTTTSSSNLMFEVPSTGLEVTITIWLEGWQQLHGSALWDVAQDDGVTLHFGMKLFTPANTFISDGPSA